MIKMEIYGISFDIVGQQPVVLLKTEGGDRFLPIWIGHPEAAAILMRLQDVDVPRPMTHDLTLGIVEVLGGEIVSVAITELNGGTFYASISVRQNGHDLEIDARPSDALALAVRADVPIYADDEVIASASVVIEEGEMNEEKMISEFRQFLENVTPDEFAAGEEDESAPEG